MPIYQKIGPTKSVIKISFISLLKITSYQLDAHRYINAIKHYLIIITGTASCLITLGLVGPAASAYPKKLFKEQLRSHNYIYINVTGLQALLTPNFEGLLILSISI